MPKPPRSDKNLRTTLRRSTRTRRGADSVKSLLARQAPVLASIADQAARQAGWRGWLSEHLPSLVMRITGVVERDGELVLFAESAGWGVRLRYAMAELEPELRRSHPAITRVAVRVLPAGRTPPG
jgi:hypothetical protein